MSWRGRKDRRLLATMTSDAFQPVRIYYAVPDRAVVTRKLGGLACMTEVPREACWQWLFEDEAASLRFGAGYDDVPVKKRPIVIGRIRFPNRGGMTFETNAIERAIEGARFFGPRLGPEVVPLRCRVVNRWFSADDGPPGELMKKLDRDVTVIDPREAEARFRCEIAGLRKRLAAKSAATEFVRRRTDSGEDVPEVEDLPLVPEEETPDFQDLSNCLQFRHLRAFEHWRGNTHLTLNAIIVRTVQQSLATGGGPQEP